MAIGDDAQAAGMLVVPANGAVGSPGKVKQGNQEITRSRDYLANGPTYWMPGVTVPTARIADGAVTNAKIGAAAVTVDKVDTYTDPNLGINKIPRYNSTGKLATNDPTAPLHAANKQYVDAAVGSGSFVSKTGDTMTGSLVIASGHLFVPTSSVALSGYTVAYIDGDGRLSRGASSERFKKNISRIEPSVLGDLFPDLFRFQMRKGDGSWKFGYIAERLAESEALRPFVVWGRDDTDETTMLDPDAPLVPLSIDFIGLLLAQVAQLHRRTLTIEARLAALEAGT
jgi:hypothetical protein